MLPFNNSRGGCRPPSKRIEKPLHCVLISLLGLCLIGWIPPDDDDRLITLIPTPASQAQIHPASKEVLEALRAAKLTIDNATNINKDYLLRTLACLQIRAGDSSGAKQTVQNIAQQAWRVNLLLGIAEAQANATTPAEARQILATAGQSVGILTVDEEGTGLLEDMVALQVKLGDIAGAKQTAENIKKGNDRVAVQNDIAVAQASAGDSMAAKQVPQQIKIAASGIFTLIAVARVQAKSGKLGASRRNLIAARQILECLGDTNGYRLDAIAAEQCDAGDFVESWKTANRITDPNTRWSALYYNIAARIASGDYSGATQAVQSMPDGVWKANAMVQIARRLLQKEQGVQTQNR